MPLRFGEANLDHLPRIIPFVHGRCGVEAFVALQADQRTAERAREHLGDFGLADTCLAFEKKWAAKLERKEHAGGEPAVGEVVVLLEQRDDGVDIGGKRDGGHGQRQEQREEERL